MSPFATMPNRDQCRERLNLAPATPGSVPPPGGLAIAMHSTLVNPSTAVPSAPHPQRELNNRLEPLLLCC